MQPHYKVRKKNYNRQINKKQRDILWRKQTRKQHKTKKINWGNYGENRLKTQTVRKMVNHASRQDESPLSLVDTKNSGP